MQDKVQMMEGLDQHEFEGMYQGVEKSGVGWHQHGVGGRNGVKKGHHVTNCRQ